MSDTQKELVKAVKAFYKKHGYPCRQTYLKDVLGIKARSTVQSMVDTLVRKGILRKTEAGQVWPDIHSL
jgi:SOS-response transcriptional repressor LexA